MSKAQADAYKTNSNQTGLRRPQADDALKLGTNAEYFVGTANMRKYITELEIETNKLKLEFSKGFQPPKKSQQSTTVIGESGDKSMAVYLKKISEELMKVCDLVKEKSGERIEIINSEQQLLGLITSAKNISNNENEGQLCQNLVEFWEGIKFGVERVQSLGDKFNTKVLHRLKQNCLGFGTSLGANTPLSDKFSQEVLKFLDRAETVWKNLRLLCACYPNGIRPGLFDDTLYLTELAKAVDFKRFPLLRTIPDLCEKLALLCQVGREWLDRDETYVIELNREIRAKRGETQEKRKVIRGEKERQTMLVKALRSAQLICHNSKQQLREINEKIREFQNEAKQV